MKLAVVAACAGLANVTVPGPLTCVHRTVTVAPAGRPSSMMAGLKDNAAGSTTLRWLLRSTLGALFVATVAVTVCSA
ncbi:MAG: hypothetical protein U0Q55_15020 [Vicinamibacterales bacterium]